MPDIKPRVSTHAEDEDVEVMVIDESAARIVPLTMAATSTNDGADLIVEDVVEENADVASSETSGSGGSHCQSGSGGSSNSWTQSLTDSATPALYFAKASTIIAEGPPPSQIGLIQGSDDAMHAPSSSMTRTPIIEASPAMAANEPPSMDLWDSLLTDIQDETHGAESVRDHRSGAQNPSDAAEEVAATADDGDSETSQSSIESSSASSSPFRSWERNHRTASRTALPEP